METQINQVRSGWVTAFLNLKTTVKYVIGNLRNDLDNMKDIQNILVLRGRGHHAPHETVDLTGIHHNIDRLEDKIDKCQQDISTLLEERSDSIS